MINVGINLWKLGEASTNSSFAPINIILPVISCTGDFCPNNILITSDGYWVANPSSTKSYEWVRIYGTGSDEPIGSDQNSYELVEEDVGCLIYCVITATNSEGSTEAFAMAVEILMAHSFGSAYSNAYNI